MPNLKQKIALVTGGASGLGKAIAERLAADGAQVVITDIQTSLGQSVAAEFGFTFLEQDVTQEGDWTRVIEEVRRRHGGLNILVNNAGLLSPPHSTLEGTQLADWDRIMDVNLKGVFLGCRAAIPTMHESGGGSIINMSSIVAMLATPMALAYGASKAAVRHLTKSVAQHCAEKKLHVRCNSVHPGLVRTPGMDLIAEKKALARGISVDAIREKTRLAIPMGDFTQMKDIAAAVAFLASDDSRHMTGAPMVVDGGIVFCDTFHTDLAGRR